MRFVDWALRYDVDLQGREVRARIAGGYASHQVFRSGRGCTLVFPGYPLPSVLATLPHGEPLLPAIAGAELEPRDAALRRAVDAAFAEPGRQPTKAILVVKDDQVIGERYARTAIAWIPRC